MPGIAAARRITSWESRVEHRHVGALQRELELLLHAAARAARNVDRHQMPGMLASRSRIGWASCLGERLRSFSGFSSEDRGSPGSCRWRSRY